MFTVRPHPPPRVPRRHPSLLPVVRWWPSAAVFPRCFFSFGLVLVFLSVYFCVRFSWVFALPAYRPWSFIFLSSLWSPLSGGRLRRLIFAVLLRAPSGGGFGPSPFPVLSLAPRSALCFSGSLLRFFSLLFGPSFFPVPVLLFGPSFLFVPSFPLGTPFILVSSPVLFSASWYIFFVWSFFIFCRPVSLYFFIYFYLFRFVRLKDCGRGG